MKNKFIICTILATISWLGVVGQTSGNGTFEKLESAIKAYDNQRYTLAYQELVSVYNDRVELDGLNRERLDYYYCLASFKLGKDDVVKKIETFRSDYPKSNYLTYLDWIYANIKFEQKDFIKAIELFRGVNMNRLSADEKQELYFKKGYSLINVDGLVDADFRTGQGIAAPNIVEAATDLKKITKNNKFYQSAVYYLAYIDYFRGDLNQAQTRFEQLINDKSYGSIVPFYLLQIKFLKGDYQTVISEGQNLRVVANNKWKTEIARILAESYFNTSDYENALIELENFENQGGVMSRDEIYMKGYSHFVKSEYREAEQPLRRVVSSNSAMGQNAAFYLGRTYLKLNQKGLAAMAFSLATSDYDPNIKEEAQFNYAKLQYDLDGNRFNRAISLLDRFINQYPDSKYVAEARELLLSAYFNSKNYQAALEAIQYIKNPDNNEKSALQKISYFRGLEHYENGDYKQALENIDVSLSNRYNAKYTALGKFWKAETLVKLGRQTEAAPLYKEYIALASKAEPEFAYAYYGLGYCRFNEQKWDEAQQNFEKLITLNTNSNLKADACNRLGDIEFARRAYWKAIENYNKASKYGGTASNYSSFQRAIMYGLVNRPQKKEAELKDIISAANSEYVDDAIYQLGTLYVKQEQFSKGADQLKNLIEQYPNSPYLAQALGELGLVYQNMGNETEALKYYKMVTQRFPTSTQARDALLGIRNIYVDKWELANNKIN